jgi:hypothetical protein
MPLRGNRSVSGGMSNGFGRTTPNARRCVREFERAG